MCGWGYGLCGWCRLRLRGTSPSRALSGWYTPAAVPSADLGGFFPSLEPTNICEPGRHRLREVGTARASCIAQTGAARPNACGRWRQASCSAAAHSGGGVRARAQALHLPLAAGRQGGSMGQRSCTGCLPTRLGFRRPRTSYVLARIRRRSAGCKAGYALYPTKQHTPNPPSRHAAERAAPPPDSASRSFHRASACQAQLRSRHPRSGSCNSPPAE